MHQGKTITVTDKVQQVIAYLQSTPGSRAILYLGTSAAVLDLIARSTDRTYPYAPVRIHLVTLPLALAVTYAFARLRPQDQERWYRLPSNQDISQVLLGIGLGSSALLSLLGIAAAKGWISAPAWGWEQTTVSAVLQSLAILGIGHVAVAWNEEMVFRGYGYDTVREAIGPVAAVAVLVPLFALAHKMQPQILLGQAALGVALTALRIQSKGIWLPIGYHWAWNFIQTALLGAADAEPSVRPIEVHGPYHWIGRPGRIQSPVC